MSTKKQQRNIFTAIRPFYFALKVAGVLPLSFRGPPEAGNFTATSSDKILTFSAFGGMLCGISLNLHRSIAQMDLSAGIVVVGWEIR